jgi:hypothetical protein
MTARIVKTQMRNARWSVLMVGPSRSRTAFFDGVEMECRMTRPVQVVDMDATLYTMRCSGDDQICTERAMAMNDAQDAGGIIMMWDGYAFRYSRCDAE